MKNIFGRINNDNNVDLFHASGEFVTSITVTGAPLWPVDSDICSEYEHPNGIVITRADAERLCIEIE